MVVGATSLLGPGRWGIGLDPFANLCPDASLIRIVIVATNQEHLQIGGAAQAGDLMSPRRFIASAGPTGGLVAGVAGSGCANLGLEAIVARGRTTGFSLATRKGRSSRGDDGRVVTATSREEFDVKGVDGSQRTGM